MPQQLNKGYRDIVEQFDRIARANLRTPKRFSDVCRAAGIHERTLARAFRTVLGTTPVRYFHDLRLRETRRALSSQYPSTATVKEIAIRFGFRELGRFAGEYHTAFGEYPSETLDRMHANRRTSRSPGDAGMPKD
jgi:AraC family ethanolamine operon transcriptional activator